jgi:predicted transcriptional regulator
MHGVIKRTINLPEPLKARIVQLAREQNRSQAAVIRDAIKWYVNRAEKRGGTST